MPSGQDYEDTFVGFLNIIHVTKNNKTKLFESPWDPVRKI
jgi:hypothetical protein